MAQMNMPVAMNRIAAIGAAYAAMVDTAIAQQGGKE
jgi:hypothetical protein